MYDTIIVGAGLSGLAVATELARHGVAGVAVVDAGAPAGRPVTATASGLEVARLALGADPDGDLPRWRPWVGPAGPHYADPTGLRRRIGGRSLCWHGLVLRMDSWECGPDTPWPAGLDEELRGAGGLYDQVEAELTKWAGTELDQARTDSERQLENWLADLSYRARPAPLAVRPVTGAHTGELPAFSPLHLWEGEAGHGRTLPDVLTGREVIAVETAGGRTRGIRTRRRDNGAVELIEAGQVVLAAGAIENTRLTAQVLGRSGEPLPVFTALNDHIVQGFAITVPASLFGPARHRDGGCLIVRGDGTTRFNVFFKLRGTTDPDLVTLDVWAMGEQQPSAGNRITFSGTTVPWTTAIAVDLTAADRDVVAGEQAALREIWGRVAERLPVPHEPLRFTEFLDNLQPIGTAYDEAVARPGRVVPFSAALGSIDHEAGSLPLGSVLTVDGAVPDTTGLHVTGPSVFPKTGAANPSLTTLALARRLATHLAGLPAAGEGVA